MAIFMYAAKLAAFAYMVLSYLVKQTTSRQKIRLVKMGIDLVDFAIHEA